MSQALSITLLIFLILLAFAVVRAKTLFAAIMLMSAFSLISALLFLLLDAPDVAFTEAAVGAGMSTILMIGALVLSVRHESTPLKPASVRFDPLPLVIVIAFGGILFWASSDVTAFGDVTTAAHQHVAAQYLARTPADIDIPNVVTAVLASYRGFDTLGEVIVILTAGIATLALLGMRRP